LLLDTQSLKQIFTQLRNFTNSEEDDDDNTRVNTAPQRMDAYTKVVAREIGKVEAILKLVQTPTFRLVESLPVIWPAATESDLIDLMNLKGIKKSEQDTYLEQYKNSPDYKPTVIANLENGKTRNGSTIKNNNSRNGGSKKKKDFWSFVNDTKKNMETHVDKAKKAALTAMNK
jgi:hypothetical protein